MPYTRDGAVKFSSHNVHSPLFNPAGSCGTCHTDVDYVVGRVTLIQNQVATTMFATEDALVEAIDAIKAAAEAPGADAALVEEARQAAPRRPTALGLHRRRKQHGLPQPAGGLRILAAATDLARQAQVKAVQALNPTQASR
jgi:nitrite reductase (cytochrome c-552)